MGVTVATARVACNTSTGTQDITTTDLGGLTPKAVIVVASRATSDATAADGAGMYIGVTDGTTHKSYSSESQHGQASSNSLMDSYDTLLNIWDGAASGTIDGTAIFDSFITEGIRIDWTGAPSSAWLLTVFFIAGTDPSVFVGSTNLATQNIGVDVTSPGFEPDFVFAFPYNSGAAAAHAQFAMGMIHNDRAGTVTTRGTYMRDRDAQATMDINGGIRSDGAIVQGGNGTSLNIYHEFSDFDSSGFTITPRHDSVGNPGNFDAAWLAVRWGAGPAVSSAVYTYSTPTSTGSNTDAGPGFEPQAVIYFPTLQTTLNTSTSDANAGSKGISFVTAGAQFTTAWSMEDAAADSNTQSLADDQAFNLPLDTGAAGMAATFTAFTSTGTTFNWTDVEGSARLYAAFAIGVDSSAATHDLTGEAFASLLGESQAVVTVVSSASNVASLYADSNALITVIASGETHASLLADASAINTIVSAGSSLANLFSDGTSVSTILVTGDSLSNLFTEGNLTATIIAAGEGFGWLTGNGDFATGVLLYGEAFASLYSDGVFTSNIISSGDGFGAGLSSGSAINTAIMSGESFGLLQSEGQTLIVLVVTGNGFGWLIGSAAVTPISAGTLIDVLFRGMFRGMSRKMR